MCARTTLKITPEDLKKAFGYDVPPGYRPSYNIAPTQPLLAISESRGERGFHFLRWGLVPPREKDTSSGSRRINTRAETLVKSSVLGNVGGFDTCLVVVDGFYEWRPGPAGKRPYRIRTESDGPFTLAGLWSCWTRGGEVLETCTVITTAANGLMRPIHDRMPAIIAPEDRDLWLSPKSKAADLQGLLVPYAGDDLEAYEVSTLVNSPANDRPACIEAVGPTTLFD